jgi:hypothetical protein
MDTAIDNTNNNNNDDSITYRPGDLTHQQAGLTLSTGLAARILAREYEPVTYDNNGGQSQRTFHGRADAGATFPDARDWNPGGWVYVSNSEMRQNDPPGGFHRGGVGALTFDRDGNLVHYDMILEESTHNCGGGTFLLYLLLLLLVVEVLCRGCVSCLHCSSLSTIYVGRTPWNTWVSCEETGPPHGKVWQVDPMGEHSPQIMTMGNEGGAWESFAYDISDLNKPRFFVTEVRGVPDSML